MRAWFFLLLQLGGCQSSQSQLQSLTNASGHQLLRLPSQPFALLAALPERPVGESLRVYIEGDGHAWIHADRPSLDPTPNNLLVAQLALEDPTPSVYLARPCQFIKQTECTSNWWTTARYAPKVIASLDAALNLLKTRLGNRQFELIGYSGGATLALLLAERRTDIVSLQTLAGNLSPEQWARQQGLAPLTESLQPNLSSVQLAGIKQRHLAGATDRVIPAELARQSVEQLNQQSCVEFHLLPKVGHQEGWLQAWPVWRNQAIECTQHFSPAPAPTAGRPRPADARRYRAAPPPVTAP